MFIRLTKILFPLITFVLLHSANIEAHSHAHKHDAEKEAKSWFTHKSMGEGIWLINDNNIDNIYLVEGTEKSLLIDTGIGKSDVNKYAKQLTDKPLIVINSHGHPDHAGGNSHFPHIHMHTDEKEGFAFYTSEIEMRKIYKTFLNLPLPKHLEDKYRPIPSITEISEGFQFDLGNRKLEVIHIPGHTIGSIALHDDKTKHLFSGDATTSMVWLHTPTSTTVEQFKTSINKLIKIEDSLNLMLSGHGEPNPPSFLHQQLDVINQILSGKCKGEIYESPIGVARLCKNEKAMIAFLPNKIHNERP